MLDLEQLEFTEKVVHEVSRLKNLLSQKVQALSASGRMTMHDVEKLKNDKWTNEYLNIVRECPSSASIPTNPDHARHALP